MEKHGFFRWATPKTGGQTAGFWSRASEKPGRTDVLPRERLRKNKAAEKRRTPNAAAALEPAADQLADLDFQQVVEIAFDPLPQHKVVIAGELAWAG